MVFPYNYSAPLPIDQAPKDGTLLLLWEAGLKEPVIGSWRFDYNRADEGELWLANDYDDYSCGYASTPLTPVLFLPLPTIEV